MTPREEASREGESPIDAQLSAPPVVYNQSASGPVATPRPTSSSGGITDLLQNRGAVLAVLFLVTGALGIPLLWMNKKFSPTERVVWATVVTIYTGILFWIVWAICMWSYRQIMGY